jgi:hypothetical protein
MTTLLSGVAVRAMQLTASSFQHAGFRVTRMPLQGHNDQRRLAAGGIIFWSGEQHHDA